MLVPIFAGLIVRYALYFAGIGDLVANEVTLTSPVTSNLRLHEAIFLLSQGASPYAGRLFLQPPLVLLLLQPLATAPRIVHFSALVLVDVLVAVAVYLIAKRHAISAKEHSEEGGAMDILGPSAAAAGYLLNPFVIGGCLAMSWQNLHCLSLVACVAFASCGRGGPSAGCAAVSLYLAPVAPLALIIPAGVLSYHCRGGGPADVEDDQVSVPMSKALPTVIRYVGLAATGFGVLIGASYLQMGRSWEFIETSFVDVVMLADLTPNVGGFWYVFCLIFKRFRLLFLFVFHAHVIIYVIPIHCRLGRFGRLGPLAACVAAIGQVHLFRAYPTGCDVACLLALLLVLPTYVVQCQQKFILLACVCMIGLGLCPTMAHAWLVWNAGNANFLFLGHLVHHVAGGHLLVTWLGAGLQLRRRRKWTKLMEKWVWGMVDEACRRPEAPAVQHSEQPPATAEAEGGRALKKRR